MTTSGQELDDDDNFPDIRAQSLDSIQPSIPAEFELQRRKENGFLSGDRRSDLKKLCAIVVFLLFIYIALELIIMLIVSPEVISKIGDFETTLFIFTPKIVELVTITGPLIVTFFILLVVVITISFLLIIKRSAKSIIKEMSEGKEERHSVILTIGGLFLLVYFFNNVFYLTVTIAGAEPFIPDYDFDLWFLVYIFAEASVWEEVVARILLIGIPLMAIDIFFRKDNLLPVRKYLIGGNFKIGYIESALVLFSSEMFALAHLAGWDFYKILPTVVAGLCFGYLFLRFGFFAAVIFHFSFDFFIIPIELFGEENVFLFGLIFLLWLLFGLIFLIYYFLKFGRFVLYELMKLPRGKVRVA